MEENWITALAAAMGFGVLGTTLGGVLGVALGFLGTATVILLTVISAATILVVIAGLHVGYHMGYEQKTKAYAIGGILLLLGAVDTVFRFVVV